MSVKENSKLNIKETIQNNIRAIRKLMKETGLVAYIIPSTDPHISEYAPLHWLSRAFISGFTGSVGTVVITHEQAGMWTDGRYFLQADEQLAGTSIDTFKLGMDGVKDYPQWLNDKFGKGDRIGFDGKVFSVNMAKGLLSAFSLKEIEIDFTCDFISQIWADRPDLPKTKIFELEEKFCGHSRQEKLANIRKGLSDNNSDYTLLCSLDDVCWTFNIRGYDVSYNPVLVAYALISNDGATLFMDKDKLPDGLEAKFSSENIMIEDYNSIEAGIENLEDDKTIYIDNARTNFWLFDTIPDAMNIVNGINISTHLKAIKNKKELDGVREAMKKDCVAMIDNAMWMEENVGTGKLTEISVMDYLESCRAKQKDYYGLSFNTIAGMAEHGAIIHYGSTKETDITITDKDLFLIDSGAQYYDGTTDITRVYHFGTPSEDERIDFTQVLMGHIDLSMAKFPVGTRGSQLDILARKYLWDSQKQYHHGTGHGVGCFMNVHEGPHSIRMDENMNVLKPGMIVSNEPGLYRSGKYGIRVENLITVKEVEIQSSDSAEFGKFLEFENLTLFPLESKLVNKKLMNQKQIDWYNDYHKEVFTQVSDRCNEKQLEWLKNKTKAI